MHQTLLVLYSFFKNCLGQIRSKWNGAEPIGIGPESPSALLYQFLSRYEDITGRIQETFDKQETIQSISEEDRNLVKRAIYILQQNGYCLEIDYHPRTNKLHLQRAEDIIPTIEAVAAQTKEILNTRHYDRLLLSTPLPAVPHTSFRTVGAGVMAVALLLSSLYFVISPEDPVASVSAAISVPSDPEPTSPPVLDAEEVISSPDPQNVKEQPQASEAPEFFSPLLAVMRNDGWLNRNNRFTFEILDKNFRPQSFSELLRSLDLPPKRLPKKIAIKDAQTGLWHLAEKQADYEYHWTTGKNAGKPVEVNPADTLAKDWVEDYLLENQRMTILEVMQGAAYLHKNGLLSFKGNRRDTLADMVRKSGEALDLKIHLPRVLYIQDRGIGSWQEVHLKDREYVIPKTDFRISVKAGDRLALVPGPEVDYPALMQQCHENPAALAEFSDYNREQILLHNITRNMRVIDAVQLDPMLKHIFVKAVCHFANLDNLYSYGRMTLSSGGRSQKRNKTGTGYRSAPQSLHRKSMSIDITPAGYHRRLKRYFKENAYYPNIVQYMGVHGKGRSAHVHIGMYRNVRQMPEELRDIYDYFYSIPHDYKLRRISYMQETAEDILKGAPSFIFLPASNHPGKNHFQADASWEL